MVHDALVHARVVAEHAGERYLHGLAGSDSRAGGRFGTGSPLGEELGIDDHVIHGFLCRGREVNDTRIDPRREYIRPIHYIIVRPESRRVQRLAAPREEETDEEQERGPHGKPPLTRGMLDPGKSRAIRALGEVVRA